MVLANCTRASTNWTKAGHLNEGETMDAESQAFPELYNLRVVIDEFSYEDLIFKRVHLILHHPDDEKVTHQYDFAALIDDYDSDDPWIDFAKQFIEQDLFTPHEVAAIEAYFSRCASQGITLHKAQQAFPITSDQVPCNAAGYGSWDGEYMFDMEEGFDCPVKFWGYYWLGDTQAVARVIHVKCGPDGRIELTGGGHGYVLDSGEVERLFAGWRRAKTSQQDETFTVRSELQPSAGIHCQTLRRGAGEPPFEAP
jgi:hypothetical protein